MIFLSLEATPLQVPGLVFRNQRLRASANFNVATETFSSSPI